MPIEHSVPCLLRTRRGQPGAHDPYCSCACHRGEGPALTADEATEQVEEVRRRLTRGLGELTGAVVLVIQAEPAGLCMVCGRDDQETRPYGAGGVEVCFDCGQLDPEETSRRMAKRIDQALGLEPPG